MNGASLPQEQIIRVKMPSRAGAVMADLVERLLEYDEYDPIGPMAKEAAMEIERLRAALKPFADYYEVLERNGRLDGHMLVSQQGDVVLGHADIQARDLKAASEALGHHHS